MKKTFKKTNKVPMWMKDMKKMKKKMDRRLRKIKTITHLLRIMLLKRKCNIVLSALFLRITSLLILGNRRVKILESLLGKQKNLHGLIVCACILVNTLDSMLCHIVRQ